MLLMLSATALITQEVRAVTQMRLTSPDFSQNAQIPDRFTCHGEDVNPHLVLENVPPEAKSLALIVDDPDAPGGTWVHWVLWNVDPRTTRIDQVTIPRGAQEGVNSWKQRHYRGPCPPSGTHRYFFRLYALNQQLNLPASTTSKDLDKAMHGKIIAQCELMGLSTHK